MAKQLASAPKPKRFHLKPAHWGIIFLLPALVHMLIFKFHPLFNAFYMSFHEWDLLNPPTWIGLDNYVRLFNDARFHNSVSVSLRYALSTTACLTVLGLGLGLMFNKATRGIAVLRAAYFVPSIMSTVVIAIIWRFIFHPSFGLQTFFTEPLGYFNVRWLTNSRLALPALVIVGVWRHLGYYSLIYLAGFQAIPEEQYEAAKIDGARPYQSLLYITLPLLRPTFLFVAIVSVINSFQSFAPAQLMTDGGPAGSTLVLPLFLYRTAIQNLHMGYGTAIAVIMFLVLMTITLIQLKLFGMGSGQ